MIFKLFPVTVYVFIGRLKKKTKNKHLRHIKDNGVLGKERIGRRDWLSELASLSHCTQIKAVSSPDIRDSFT